MTDATNPTGENSPQDEPIDRALADLLARPALWSEGTDATEDAIVAAICAERDAEVEGEAAVSRAPFGERARGGRAERWIVPAAVGIAAAVLVLMGASVLTSSDTSADGVIVALADPGSSAASAEAVVADTPRGTRITLDVTDLPPAPEGTFYEVSLVDGDDQVSAGTFHVREGNGEIDLWAGVALDTHPEIVVTRQRLDEPTDAVGDVVLVGEVPR